MLARKQKKRRAELNRINRQKGTYGNGDGLDVAIRRAGPSKRKPQRTVGVMAVTVSPSIKVISANDYSNWWTSLPRNKSSAAIQASDNQTAVVSPYQNLDELGGVMQAVLHRLTALETVCPNHMQDSVTTTTANGVTTHRVQMLDHHGKTVIVTFEQPT